MRTKGTLWQLTKKSSSCWLDTSQFTRMQEDAAARALSVPIVYGSVAFFLGKKNPTEHTHKWSIYVRHADDKDLSYIVSKVEFYLHPSFTNAIRGQSPSWSGGMCASAALIRTQQITTDNSPCVLSSAEFTAPPFAVSETGWGEFDVTIKLYLRDPALEPITVTHKLALYPPTGQYNEKPVLSERYDEIVFNALPSHEGLRKALQQGPQNLAPPYPYQEFFPSYSATDDLARIQAARQKIHDMKIEMTDRLNRARVEADREKDELRALGAV